MHSENDRLGLNALLGKYASDLYAMYVEYPHKSVWRRAVDDGVYRTALGTLLSGECFPPLLLYVHVPFCPKLCYFCSCHTTATNRYKDVTAYLELLYREIDLLAGFIEQHGLRTDFRELHLGGGSPTMLTPKDFTHLCTRLSRLTDISQLHEFALEIDPRHVSRDRLAFYHDRGVNRISFGVQDFDSRVQQAVGRVQPPELLERLLTPEVRDWFSGINFDIMWGLPGQTRESFVRTIETVIRFSPERISLLRLHYAPDVKKNQHLMNVADFPDHFERTALFLDAVQMLTVAGYVRVGVDHFVKPGDAIATAMMEGKMCWNSLGYAAGRYHDVVGIGTGSASRITDGYYSQNVYNQQEYAELLAVGRFPILREYELSPDDVLRRDLLHRLRGYGRIDCRDMEIRYDITFRTYFADELSRLTPFIDDKLVCIEGEEIAITGAGRIFTTLICRVFDSYAA